MTRRSRDRETTKAPTGSVGALLVRPRDYRGNHSSGTTVSTEVDAAVVVVDVGRGRVVVVVVDGDPLVVVSVGSVVVGSVVVGDGVVVGTVVVGEGHGVVGRVVGVVGTGIVIVGSDGVVDGTDGDGRVDVGRSVEPTGSPARASAARIRSSSAARSFSFFTFAAC